MFNLAQIENLSAEILPYLKNIRDWFPVILFDTNDLAAAAIPQTEFFNNANAPGICNLEKLNEVPYHFICTHIGVQIWGTKADTIVTWRRTEVEIEIDQKKLPRLPTCCLPGGGGVNADADVGTAAAGPQFATTGLGNFMFEYAAPWAVEPNQAFRAYLYSDGTAVAATTGVRILLQGLMARPAM